jgi:hypothetical protein
MMANSKLVVRRNAAWLLALHDAETGEMLPAQADLRIEQDPRDLTKVVVTFYASPLVGQAVAIEVDDLA